MKNTHKLCGAVLLAALGMAVIVPNATKAESNSWTGEGVVEFEKDTTPDTVTPNSTVQPPLTIPVNPTGGDLKIVAITPLDFEKHKILADGRDEEYTVKPYNEAAFGDMEHFVDFKDMRSGLDHTYTISATMTQEFTHANGAILDGAEIVYDNISVGSNGTANAEKLKPAGLTATTQTLDYNTKTLFLDNKDPNKGFGQYKIVFGNRNNGTDDLKNSVRLKVPGHNAKSVGKYEAVITWTIESTVNP